MYENALVCPKCGSDFIEFNAFDGLSPIEEQFMYTCGECQHQFNGYDDANETNESTVDNSEE